MSRTLLVTDIFGASTPLRELAAAIRTERILSPYGNEQPQFASESQAYAAFQDTGGVEAYARLLQAELAARTEIDTIIAFSAGASAAWLTLAGPAGDRITRAVLFYGSRIRDHIRLSPRCPVRLIFAEHEASCDPVALVQVLTARGLQADIMPGSRHGFMNPLSTGYDPVLAARFHRELRALCAPDAP